MRKTSEVSQSEARSGSRPSATSRRELAPGLVLHAQLGEHGDEPRPPRAAAVRVGGEHPHDRRELGEPPALAADAEHLDPVHARRVAPRHEAAPLVGALRVRLGRLEAPVAQRERRGVVLGDVEHERLGGPLGHLAQRRDRAAGGRKVAERHERRHPPGHRLRADLGVAELLAERHGLGQHREDLLDRGRAVRPVRAHEHGGEAGAVVDVPRHGDRAAPRDAAAVTVALQVQRAGEAREQADAQRRVVRAERGGRLLEQRDRAAVGHARPPAGLLVPDRRAREQRRVPALARERRGAREGVDRGERRPRAMAREAQLEEDLGPVVRAELERGAQPRRGFVEGQRGPRGARSLEVVRDRAVRRAERCRGREVVGEVGERTAGAGAPRLERLADAEVELGTARPGEPVVERPAHELVGEAPPAPMAGDLVDHAAGVGLFERLEQLGVAEPGGAADDVEVDLGPCGGGELEQVGGARREPREPLAHDLAHALRTAELPRRAVHPQLAAGQLDGARLDQRAPLLAQQEGVPLGERAQRLRQRRRPVDARGPADELRHLGFGEAAEAQPHDVVAPEVGEALGERGRDVRLGVAERPQQQQPAVAGPGELAEQQQGGAVGPVQVLEHEQRRAAPRDAGEQLGHRGVQPVALGVGVGLGRRREPAGARAEVGQQAGQLAARDAQRRPQLLRRERADELLERLGEGPVRRAQDGVAGAVEDTHAVGCGAGGELAHEPALARARLAPEHDDAAPLTVGARQQRAQAVQLGRAADERERRCDAKCARESVHSPFPGDADQI